MFFGAGGAGSWKGRRALTRLLLSLATEQKFEATSTLFVISHVFLVSQDALEAMFLWCLWALTKRRDNIVLADMVVWIWRWTRWPTKKEKEKSGRHGVGHGGRHGDRQGGRHGGRYGGRHRNPIWWESWWCGWLIGLKLFWPESYPACIFSKLC